MIPGILKYRYHECITAVIHPDLNKNIDQRRKHHVEQPSNEDDEHYYNPGDGRPVGTHQYTGSSSYKYPMKMNNLERIRNITKNANIFQPINKIFTVRIRDPEFVSSIVPAPAAICSYTKPASKLSIMGPNVTYAMISVIIDAIAVTTWPTGLEIFFHLLV